MTMTQDRTDGPVVANVVLDVGFTGTRKGLTVGQVLTLEQQLLALSAGEHGWRFHHGNCVGADVQAADLARRLGAHVIAHPPDEGRLQQHQIDSDEYRTAKPYLERNRAIVRESDVLVAAPLELEERQRGGTWYTVRQARARGMRVIIVWSDGRVTW